MPIKDKGRHYFVSNWAAKVIPMDFWVGLRAYTSVKKFDPKATIPLIEVNNTLFSNADGTGFNISKGYLLGATKLTGECIYLKQSTSYIAGDSKCNKLRGYICQWSSRTNFSILVIKSGNLIVFSML